MAGLSNHLTAPGSTGNYRRTVASGSPTRERPASLDMLLIALGVAILCYVWRVQDLYPIIASVRAPILASLAVVVLYVISQDRRRALVTASHPITRFVLLILGLALLSVPTSVYQGLSLHFIVNDFSKNVLLFVILAASMRTFHDVRRMTAVLVIGGALYAQFVYFNVAVGANGRLGGIVYYDANDIGMFLTCTMPLALFFLIRGRNVLVKACAALALGLFVLVIIKSGSRGAFLALVAVGVYFLFFLSSVPVRLRVMAVASSVAMLMIVGGEQYWGMMSTMLNPKDDYNWSGNSDSGRMDVWKRGIGYMIDRPVTGVGVSAFGVAEGTISDIAGRQAYGVGVKWSAAHNSFVQIGAELGVGGLLLFILMLRAGYTTARAGPAQPGRSKTISDEEVLGQALGGAIVGYVVGGFFLSQAYSAYLMVLCALIVGLDVTRRKTVPVTRRHSNHSARRPHPPRVQSVIRS